jgi:PAS domain S-box-containing protein
MSLTKEFLDHLTPAQLVERLTLALEGTELGIWDWDLRDNSVQYDRRWCEILGLDFASTPQQIETWSSRVHPDDIGKCYAAIQEHLEGRTARYEIPHRMRHADGTWRHLVGRGRIADRDANGNPIRFTGTLDDVTAFELARVQSALDQAARLGALSRFSATLAHELNTPLQVMLVAADLLATQCKADPAQPQEVRDAVESLRVMAHRASRITNALRVLARDARNDPEQSVEVAQVLEQVGALSVGRFESRGIKLEMTDRTQGGRVSGRPSEVLRALLNVVDNAFDAAGQGGWTRIEAERAGNRIVLRCVDSGPGIPPALIPRIGTPHFTTKSPGEGVGLGLSITKSLVERGRGVFAYVLGAPHTTFELRLPAVMDRADG